VGRIRPSSKEHQKADWKKHKAMCMLMRARVSGGAPTDLVDGGHKRDEYVGTLIWSPGLKFATMPPFPQVRGVSSWKTSLSLCAKRAPPLTSTGI